MNKHDKRVFKTKKLLSRALFELLLEKELDQITVAELTDKAYISRGAFYYHYENIYCLYKDIVEAFYKEFEYLMSNNPTVSWEKALSQLLSFIQENAHIVRVLSLSHGKQELRSELLTLFEDRLTEITLYEMKADHLQEDWKYMIRYHSSGVVSVFLLWIESNFSLPKESILKMISEIDLRCDSMYIKSSSDD